LDTWTTDTLEAGIRPLAEQLGLKTGVYFGLIRTAVTGKTATPPLFQTMEVLGKTRCAKRVKAALEKLQLLF
jgi:glutamyl-tRNA synthetase